MISQIRVLKFRRNKVVGGDVPYKKGNPNPGCPDFYASEDSLTVMRNSSTVSSPASNVLSI